MAHYAKLGLNSKVLGVHAVDDKDCLDADGVEDEEVGRVFLERLHHWPFWKQTSRNTRRGKHYTDETLSADQSKALRGNYAGQGMIYDDDNDLFIEKKPYASWVLNTTTVRWQSPIGDAPAVTAEQLAANSFYAWNEDTQAWDLTTL